MSIENSFTNIPIAELQKKIVEMEKLIHIVSRKDPAPLISVVKCVNIIGNSLSIDAIPYLVKVDWVFPGVFNVLWNTISSFFLNGVDLLIKGILWFLTALLVGICFISWIIIPLVYSYFYCEESFSASNVTLLVLSLEIILMLVLVKLFYRPLRNSLSSIFKFFHSLLMVSFFILPSMVMWVGLAYLLYDFYFQIEYYYIDHGLTDFALLILFLWSAWPSKPENYLYWLGFPNPGLRSCRGENDWKGIVTFTRILIYILGILLIYVALINTLSVILILYFLEIRTAYLLTALIISLCFFSFIWRPIIIGHSTRNSTQGYIEVVTAWNYFTHIFLFKKEINKAINKIVLHNKRKVRKNPLLVICDRCLKRYNCTKYRLQRGRIVSIGKCPLCGSDEVNIAGVRKIVLFLDKDYFGIRRKIHSTLIVGIFFPHDPSGDGPGNPALGGWNIDFDQLLIGNVDSGIIETFITTLQANGGFTTGSFRSKECLLTADHNVEQEDLNRLQDYFGHIKSVNVKETYNYRNSFEKASSLAWNIH